MVRPRYILEYIGLRAASGLLNALPYRLVLSLGWLIAAAAGSAHVPETEKTE